MTTKDQDPGASVHTTEMHTADLQWTEDGQPLSTQFDDVYFSKANGLEETRYVFLQHNQLPDRWKQLGDHDSFVIAETGFGTGLNFLAAWQLWQQQVETAAQLHFFSVEKYPLSRDDLRKALALWPELSSYSDQLIANYPRELKPGYHQMVFAGGAVRLTLAIGEAQDGFEQLLETRHPLFEKPQQTIDAWFLDGFAPSKNPDMWQPELFSLMQKLSTTGTTAATFTAAGIVKRGLKGAGFEIQKVPGFGHKREMVIAKLIETHTPAPAEDFPESPHNSANEIPWHSSDRSHPNTPEKTALVIGAGLAGCSIANNLAHRGWRVQVIERHKAPGQEASGNPQGILYVKLSHRAETLSDFNLAALQFAQRHYQSYWNQASNWNQVSSREGLPASSTDAIAGEQCGVLQLAETEKQQKQQRLIAESLHTQDLARHVDVAEAENIAGVRLGKSGLYFPQSGWLCPPQLCAHLLDHPNIEFIGNTRVKQLKQNDVKQNGVKHWQLFGHTISSEHQSESGSDDPILIASASVAIICNANDLKQLSQTQSLPVKPVRGQISQVPSDGNSAQLKTVLCAEGYIAPQHQGNHCLGASFDLTSTDTRTTEADHQQNLQRLIEQFPNVMAHEHDPSNLNGRAALRCTTPDYLPLAGQVPHHDEFLARYALLRKNARSEIPRQGAYHGNLYVSAGYGSRGLAYVPLCTEMLAAQINGDITPVGRDLQKALSPARFIVRDLIRKKI